MAGLLEWGAPSPCGTIEARPMNRFERQYMVSPGKNGIWKYWVLSKEGDAGSRGTKAAAKAACEADFARRLLEVPAVRELVESARICVDPDTIWEMAALADLRKALTPFTKEGS